MIEVFLNYFSEHYPEIALVILAATALIWLVWKTRGLYEGFRKVENKAQDLPCRAHEEDLERFKRLPCVQHTDKIAEHSERHNQVEVSLARLETSISYMQKSIDNLSQSLQSNTPITLNPFTQRQSPITITQKGFEMIERLRLDAMFEENWERIRLLIEHHAKSKNPYDIQQFCIEQAVVFPDKFLTDEQIDILKTDAYKMGLPLTSYMNVVAVLSRDRYFKEHDIDVAEVDKASPNL